ncbi:hypothetical protein I6A84_15310 [Frankia sp. CNm7]|uniref:Uncharacterized protein n=1 Tax=Frankia nepalensis TaxID=1836974 RepID=A0A937RE87_9ACTN|nr:hypothetical protein [Frankia nepalensis]MBL7496858.1 hypothetical protein [Frankia nepalensis]MBL7514682.1 hypothetical protein [Frankia nepalensis]MBL7519434.1 hypothetical protein [Frankia nepalensis]MBL7630483.1 hypothetical protein [Frankia nepalensis]
MDAPAPGTTSALARSLRLTATLLAGYGAHEPGPSADVQLGQLGQGVGIPWWNGVVSYEGVVS